MNKEIIKQIKIPTILMVVSAVLFYLVDFHSYTFSIGRRISNCAQDPLSSFPCYAIYDISTLITMAGIFIFSLLTAVIKMILFVRVSKKL